MRRDLEVIASIAEALNSAPTVQIALERTLEVIAAELKLQALANVQQHARAKNVTVSMRCTPRAVTLTIEDDGIGFDPRRVSEERHGIRGMRERARLAGGALHVTSLFNKLGAENRTQAVALARERGWVSG